MDCIYNSKDAGSVVVRFSDNSRIYIPQGDDGSGKIYFFEGNGEFKDWKKENKVKLDTFGAISVSKEGAWVLSWDCLNDDGERKPIEWFRKNTESWKYIEEGMYDIYTNDKVTAIVLF